MSTKRFYEVISPMFPGGALTDAQREGIEMTIAEIKASRPRISRQGGASILGQEFHETGKRMQPVYENLRYSASGLRSTFRKYFTAAQAQEYEGNAVAIANRAYANRMGNGDEASGDGFRFRGRGKIQITGRDNYLRLGPMLGVDLIANPELAMDPEISTKIAVIGMRDGVFTGRTLYDVEEAPGQPVDFENDRAVVNGSDHAKQIAGYINVFYEALEDVDLLADSRAIKAANNSVKASNVGIAAAGGKVIADVVDALGSSPQEIILAAQQGLTLANMLKVGGGAMAVLFIALMVYQRVQAKRVEAARRDDYERDGK